MPALTPKTNPTKIVCTLGPATADRAVLRRMLAAGMDVARLNFSHGDHETHARMLQMLREVSEQANQHVAAIADLQGPKIRTGRLRDGKPVELKAGQSLQISAGGDELGDQQRVWTNYVSLADDVKSGDALLLDDGLLQLRVEAVSGGTVTTTVLVGGILGEHKGINLPDTDVSAPALTPKDKRDLEFALEQGVDYVALSFVRKPEDILALQEACESCGRSLPLIAKLEKPEALNHLDEIVASVDAVMVARGDLGVELPPEEVPVWQKRIIRLCAQMRVPVITATQMLDSMRNNPRPTRAEASDVANAIFDGTDAVMLSGETAIGKYPVETVEMMRRICASAEQEQFSTRPHLRTPLASPDESLEIADAVSRAAARTAEEVHASAILAFTESGSTARMASKSRPMVPIIAVTPLKATARRCSLYWGVTPVLTQHAAATDDVIPRCVAEVQRLGLVSAGDAVVITAGTPMGRPGTTNMMRIHRVGPTA